MPTLYEVAHNIKSIDLSAYPAGRLRQYLRASAFNYPRHIILCSFILIWYKLF